MKESYNAVLTLSLLGGGVNNTLVCFKKNNKNCSKEGLRN